MALSPHRLFTQVLGAWHWLSLWQVLRHALPPHVYGAHGMFSGVRQVPRPSQAEGGTKVVVPAHAAGLQIVPALT